MMKKGRSRNAKAEIESVSSQQTLPILSTSYEGQVYDILTHTWMGKMSGWLSPASLGLATYDWLAHLTIAPAKQLNLLQKAYRNFFDIAVDMVQGSSNNNCFQYLSFKKVDQRFKEQGWDVFPFTLYAKNFLLWEKWWNEATTSIRGVSKHHEQVVNFTARQMLDMLSPSNYVLTNPEVLKVTINEQGTNFIAGFNNFSDDMLRIIYKQPPAGTEKYQVGKTVAVTPGKVIFKNNLMELIQYKSTTTKVNADPILIIPAWIMKYYILDLSPQNSLVKYLVSKGHTVFMISWKNPGASDRNLGLDDYLDSGIMSAIDVINKIVPNSKINAVGYCLGGTMLMIAAAVMAASSDNRLKSISLFAAQVDFKDPGELSLFIDESQIAYLEDIMWEEGYLDGAQMSWAFSMLRSHDLIWSRMVHHYLLGKRWSMTDIMAWDYDTTRLPLRMHAEYLNNLFLNNELVQGSYEVGKKRIALIDINVPIFAVGTIKDHVSPWRSVYKVHLFTNTDITFVLTSGGHNAGIVSEPGHKNRHYQMLERKKNQKYLSYSAWQEMAPKYEGSWWPAWEKWLSSLSDSKILPPPIGGSKEKYSIIYNAPGQYVLQK